MQFLHPQIERVSVAWQERPFSGRVHRAALPQGLSCAEIVASVPNLDVRRFLQVGMICVNGEPVPREMWPFVRPKSRNDIIVTLHMPIRGGGGGGAKDVLRIVAAIALVVIATAISSGAAAPFLGELFAAGTIGAQILAAGVTIGGALLLGAFVKPPASKVEDATAEEETGETAALQGNQLRRGGAIPRVVGTHRAFPSFLSQPLVDIDEYDEVIEGVYGFVGPHQLRDIKFGDVLADEIDTDQLEYQFYELIPGEGGIDEDVQLMLHMNGAQNSVDFPDSSDYGRDFTAQGSVFIDKRLGFLGLSAAYFAGSLSYLQTPSVPGFAVQDGDFLIDFKFEWDTIGTAEGHACGHTDSGLTAAGSAFYVRKNTAGFMELIVSNGTTFTTLTSTTTVNTGKHHFAGGRIGNTLYLWSDGIVQATAAFTGTVPSCSGTFDIGGRGSGASTANWQGWLDEFRFTVGKSWVAANQNFTPSVVEYKPADPTLIERYGKTGSPGIKLNRHDILNDTSTQSTRDKLANQTVPQRSLPQSQSVFVRGRGLDEVWVTLSIQGLFYTDDNFNRDWFNALPFRIRVRALGETEWFNLPEIHIHDRRTAPFPRMLVFRWDNATTLPNGVPNVVPPLRKGWRAAYSTVPVQTVSPAGLGGWEANSHFYAGTGDTYFTNENFSTSGLRNIRLSTERAEFFLDGLVPKGPIEVEIRRGQMYIADKFTYSSYNLVTDPPTDALADGVYDLFGYASLGGDFVIVLKQSNASDEIIISRTSAVWNQPPIARKGEFAAIYVKVRGRNLDAMSVLASGLVPDWDGSGWTGLHATSNPAPHYRDVLVGRLNDNRIPASLIDDSVLLEWRTRCEDLQFACNAVFSSENVDRVLEVIASCGYARPRHSELWDVAQDRDFTSITPVQMFTPRNVRNFRWDKAFVRHRPDGLRVRFNDASDNYVERTIIVPRLDVLTAQPGRLEEIRYDGLVSEQEVVVKALYDQQQVIDRFTFYYAEADIENLVCRRGDLVLLQHDTLDQFAGFSRVLEAEIEDGVVTSIRLDGSVSPVDVFFTTPTEFFDTPTQFFSDNVGAAIRLKDGTVTTFEAELDSSGFVLTPTQLTGISSDVLERECLVTTGRLLRANRRMLVYDISPKADLTADITLVDEAPQLWQFPEPLQVQDAFMRNKIINGDMRLDQRGQGAAHTLTDDTLSYTLDRWWAFNLDTVGSAAAFNIQQSTTSAPVGFSHYMRASTVDDVPDPLPVGDRYLIGHYLGEDAVSDFSWGTANGRSVSLSFMARASVAGLYAGSINNPSGTHSYVFTFSVPTANTWVRRVITVPAPPAGSDWDVSAFGSALHIHYVIGSGSTFRTTQPNAWVAGDFNTAVGVTNAVSTLGATFDITGVQLEIGPATVFEWLPDTIIKDLAYPYFQAIRGVGIFNVIGEGFAQTTSQALLTIPLKAPMRRQPYSVSTPNGALFALQHEATATATTFVVQGSPATDNEHVASLFVGVASGLTVGNGCQLVTNDPSAVINVDAEIHP